MYTFEVPDNYDLSLEEVLEKVDSLKVFEDVLGFTPEIGVEYLSPFREDKKGNTKFEWRDNQLYFIDFADPKHRIRSCVQAVMDIKNMKLYEALNYINKKFVLLTESSAPKGHAPRKINIKLSNEKPKYQITEFDFRDKKFWYDRYGITREQLVSDNVFKVQWFCVYSPKIGDYITTVPYEPIYVYPFPSGNAKFYCPTSKEPRMKWLGNMSYNDIGNYNNLDPTGDLLLVTKSYKDNRVTRNCGLKNNIWLQCETAFPSIGIVNDLCTRFSRILFWYDNDTAGIEGMNEIVNYINILYPGKAFGITLPHSYLERGIKDPSDLRHKEGQDKLQQFVNDTIINY